MLHECSDLVGTDYEIIDRALGEGYPARIRGVSGTIADQIIATAESKGLASETRWHSEITERYREWPVQALRPLPGAVEVLETLAGAGLSLVLVSNASPDVRALWSESALAHLFDHCVFSCDLGHVKPDAEIYLAALGALRAEPAEVLFVGDGSDDELGGAAAVGMQGLLVRADRSDTYDDDLYANLSWSGPQVDCLMDVGTYVLARLSSPSP